MNYFDTSALVKRFVEEAGSASVDALVSAGPVGTATVAFAEVHAGLARKQRDGDLTHSEYETACLKRAPAEDVTFVASDERLLEAARAERLAGANPERV